MHFQIQSGRNLQSTSATDPGKSGGREHKPHVTDHGREVHDDPLRSVETSDTTQPVVGQHQLYHC